MSKPHFLRSRGYSSCYLESHILGWFLTIASEWASLSTPASPSRHDLFAPRSCRHTYVSTMLRQKIPGFLAHCIPFLASIDTVGTG